MREVSPIRAARLLGINRATVYRWCRDAAAGRPSKIQQVRCTVTGRWFIPRDEIDRILSEHAASLE